MNGTEQKERGKAYERMQKQLDELSIEIHNAWKVEVEARQEASRTTDLFIAKEVGRVESLFAKMIDEETQFRKQAIITVMQSLERRVVNRTDAIQMTVYAFLKLPWWKRWGWVLFGFWFLEKTYRQSPADTARVAEATAEQNARREGGMAPASISEENLRKAQSASERPQ